MISALATVQTTNINASNYWRTLYAGWASPPATWPGRAIVPSAPTPTTNPDGHLDGAQRLDDAHVRLQGWAHDADLPNAAVTVRALVDGTVAGQASAGIARADVGAHGFDVVVPVDGQAHLVCAQAVNLGGGSDVVLGGCATVAPAAHNPDGHLDQVTRTDPSHVRLGGWAHDADADGAAVTVFALVDGNVSGQRSADLARPDVGPHGFDFVIPLDSAPHTVCVLAANLGGGQNTILDGCTRLPAVAPVLGDLDGDGYVGCADEAILKAHFGQSGPSVPGDLNQDGIVNITDLSLLLSRFNPPPNEGPCPS